MKELNLVERYKKEIVDKVNNQIKYDKENKVINSTYLKGDKNYYKLHFKNNSFNEIEEFVLDSDSSLNDINSKLELVNSLIDSIVGDDIDKMFSQEFDILDTLRGDLNKLKKIVSEKEDDK